MRFRPEQTTNSNETGGAVAGAERQAVRACWSAAAALLGATSAMAAGGHHALDDAVILEPGTCQVESWLTRARDHQRLLHVGSSCRVGPLELGVAAEPARGDEGRQTGYQLQGKWAAEVVPGFNAGLSLTGGWQAHARPRYQTTNVAGLFSWFARDDLAFHLNLGRDLLRGQADEDRSGVSVEWTARPGWSLTGERYIETRTHFARAGARWAINDSWSVDLSRAHRLRGPAASNWTFGATWVFARP